MWLAQRGIEIIAALLKQFPVIATGLDETVRDFPPNLTMPSARTLNPIDLDAWIIDNAEHQRISEEEQPHMEIGQSHEDATRIGAEPTCQHSHQIVCVPEPYRSILPGRTTTGSR
jgi:hypothetical protein